MDITELAKLAVIAQRYISAASYEELHTNGAEVESGFFVVYNDRTGQSKSVVHHRESGFIFKNWWRAPDAKFSASGSYIGEVTWGDVTYPIRLPFFHVFDEVVAQEFIDGETHDCNGRSHCMHTDDLCRVTGYVDCHVGNWKILNGEVVLFDFD